jgi:hypothetical protein
VSKEKDIKEKAIHIRMESVDRRSNVLIEEEKGNKDDVNMIASKNQSNVN